MADYHEFASGIYIEKTSLTYTEKVLNVLNTINNRYIGKQLIYRLKLAQKTLVITNDGISLKPKKNAEAKPFLGASLDKYVKAGYEFGRELKITATPSGKSAVSIVGVVGKGVGGNVQVDFDPSAWKASGESLSPGETADQVLFHELVHVMEYMYGQFYPKNFNVDPNIESYSEFFAILVANIYISECKGVMFRRDHVDMTMLPQRLSNSYSYYMRYKIQIDEIFSMFRDFCVAVANSSAEFNPFKPAARMLGFRP